jgi:acyl-CoA thioester hydrolase
MKEHTVTTRVRYSETDQMGVVYHAYYLYYFELGRTELLRAAGFRYRDLEARGIYLVVTESALRHRAPARYDDELKILTRVTSVGKASLRFEYSVLGPEGRLLTDGHTELAMVGQDRTPVRIPAEVAAALR